ncbi:MAG: DUF2334 domain-containing protein [Candidatus Eremiobacteraeota bacterium]|nr:DUF2334 domain-containing protein [Candidatus Eremiobacteraeota bacterium]
MWQNNSFRGIAIAAIISATACSGTNGLTSGANSALPSSAHSRAHRHGFPGAAYPAMGVRDVSLVSWASQQRSLDASRRPGRGSSGGRWTRGREHHFPGALGSASTLVLYDNTLQWGYLGELYAMEVANLAGHFGTVTVEPISNYTQGQMKPFTAAVYIGSTYSSNVTDLPAAFYSDVASGSTAVIWMNDNIWNLAQAIGATAFENAYGWDPTQSFFAPNNHADNVTNVVYKNAAFTRTMPNGSDGGVLHPAIASGSGYPAVTVLANAVDNTVSPPKSFPWAIRSRNLTYIGEIPFQYVTESDRYTVFEDLLYDALAPAAPTQHLALVRLEDVNADDDPAQLMQIEQYLASINVPYGVNVIPFYRDPLGYYNNGQPEEIHLRDADPAYLSALQYASSHGGTLIDEGYTHQYSNVKNPYTGVSGDDAEFFLASIDAADHVVWNGPIPGDDNGFAMDHIAKAKAEFHEAHLNPPELWVTPHYFATDTDYNAIARLFDARYERSLYFSGILTGTVDRSRYVGQYFAYPVYDVYGTYIVPENLGDYEPLPVNGNPARLPADIVNEARLNLAVRNGYASFFFDPTYGLAPLQQTIAGLQGLGYTFVSPTSVLPTQIWKGKHSCALPRSRGRKR